MCAVLANDIQFKEADSCLSQSCCTSTSLYRTHRLFLNEERFHHHHHRSSYSSGEHRKSRKRRRRIRFSASGLTSVHSFSASLASSLFSLPSIRISCMDFSLMRSLRYFHQVALMCARSNSIFDVMSSAPFSRSLFLQFSVWSFFLVFVEGICLRKFVFRLWFLTSLYRVRSRWTMLRCNLIFKNFSFKSWGFTKQHKKNAQSLACNASCMSLLQQKIKSLHEVSFVSRFLTVTVSENNAIRGSKLWYWESDLYLEFKIAHHNNDHLSMSVAIIFEV